jgi:AbrB family looped-hinge helix DNA binding protein
MRLPIIARRTIGPKGQITFPAKWRKAFGVKPGTKLEVYPGTDGSLEFRVVRPSRIMDYLGDLKERHG